MVVIKLIPPMRFKMNKGLSQLPAHGKGIITLSEKQGKSIISIGQIRKQAPRRGECSQVQINSF